MEQGILSRKEKKKMVWLITRSVLETDKFKHMRSGTKGKSHWTLFERLTGIFSIFLKIFQLYARGHRNVENILVRELEFEFPNLPESFNGYRILHLTDLHLDCVEGIEKVICKKIENLKYDVCVITGDYREKIHGPYKQIFPSMSEIAANITAKDGIYAILGNHDTYLMIEHFEKMGISVLGNESVSLKRKNSKISLTGIDDTFYYYTDQVLNCMAEELDDFKILLAHSPEMYDTAANNKYDLYLCGHTHGGQICLPGGVPVITHQYEGRKYHQGIWHYLSMTGYTSPGCGASGIPIRFNCPGEVTVITLRKEQK
ncbi:MAG: metallophosphoesterase [bacterium]|nr:metallophosphoesterase [bacterium]